MTPFIRHALIALLLFTPPAALASPPPNYQTHILPIFQKHCADCHSPTTQKAELNLLTLPALARGSESGPVLKPANLEDSKLWHMISENKMPAEDNPPLSPSEKQLIRQWIESGLGADLQSLDSSTLNPVNFHQVQAILFRRCTMCHGQQYNEGELDLRTHASILKGGESGPAITPGAPDASLIIQKMADADMPPADSHSNAGIEPMLETEVAILRQWIAAGAPPQTQGPDIATTAPDTLVSNEDRQFWSFQSPKPPAIPSLKSKDIRNPIDAFIGARLKQNNLTFNPQANRLALLRRATFDLTGLPPTQQQINAFLADTSPLAYEAMIDRLLASPRYGERWSRFWLDLAGYADSEGKRSADMIRASAWRYRDYVIRAFNDDKPYDQFLIEQLAGDELVNHQNIDNFTQTEIQTLAATGFLRMAPDGTTANPVNRIEDRLEVIADEIDILGRSVMGLTFKCARCHSHKYDPIPQRDYYRLTAIFKGAYDEFDWMVPQAFNNQWKKSKHRQLIAMTADEKANHQTTLQKAQAKIDKTQIQFDKMLTQQKDDKKAGAKADSKLASKIKSTQKNINNWKKALPLAPQIRALWDRGQPSPTFILRRGDPNSPTRLVGPGVPSVLTDGQTPFAYAKPFKNAPQTGMRLAFAKWLTQPSHPLTARVFVNRIWHQHFGVGIVTTLDDFGANGAPPTHPLLLDYLATQFTQQNFSIKSLHRLIMNSTTYRQSTHTTPAHQKHDPQNALYSRMPLRRLDAEQLRDSLLAIADQLDTNPFGPPDKVTVRTDGMVTSNTTNQDSRRRSIYLQQRRSQLPTILQSFDLPQMNPNCTSRIASNIVSQPLHLLNNKLVHDLAAAFANRLQAQAPNNPPAQINLAYNLALGRPPNPNETTLAIDSLQRLTASWQDSPTTGDSEPQNPQTRALADFTHMLFNTAAFLYID